MNCPGYQNLLPQEKYDRLGKLIHLYQNDQDFFNSANKEIGIATRFGLFDGVEIMPPRQTIENDSSSPQN